MTYLAAAEAVLRTARRPLTVGEITGMAINGGLIRSKGRTPNATMSAALYTALKTASKGHIRREYKPGPTRAARDSVRWVWSAH